MKTAPFPLMQPLRRFLGVTFIKAQQLTNQTSIPSSLIKVTLETTPYNVFFSVIELVPSSVYLLKVKYIA